jgi:hypothetical protein
VDRGFDLSGHSEGWGGWCHVKGLLMFLGIQVLFELQFWADGCKWVLACLRRVFMVFYREGDTEYYSRKSRGIDAIAGLRVHPLQIVAQTPQECRLRSACTC